MNAFQPPPQTRKTLSPRKMSSSSSVSSLSSSFSEQSESDDTPEKTSTGDTYEVPFEAPSGEAAAVENPDVSGSEDASEKSSSAAAYASSEAGSSLSQVSKLILPKMG